MTARRLLADLWTLPNTLLGLWVGLLLARGLPRRAPGYDFWIFDSGGGISRQVRAAGPWATTFGAVVVFWEPSGSKDPRMLRHEAWHVGQYRRLGPFFLPLYVMFLPLTGWRERHPLERAAYRA